VNKLWLSIMKMPKIVTDSREKDCLVIDYSYYDCKKNVRDMNVIVSGLHPTPINR
jgi:hypothetical protein